MLKKLLIFSSLVCFFFGIAAVPALASPQVKITVDDQTIALDTVPVFRGNSILIPARQIVESMGGDVYWNQIERAVTIKKGDTTIILILNNKIAQVNGQEIEMPQPPVLVNNKLMVPLRFVTEGLKAKVEWDAKTSTVKIFTPQNVDQEPLALLEESNKKSQEMKQYSADLDADIDIDTAVAGIAQKIKFSMVGDMKIDAAKQDFSIIGKVGIKQGMVNQEFNLEMVMKDKTMYFKEPTSGKWQKLSADSGELGSFNQSFSQSVEKQVYLQEMIDQAKDEGFYRTVSFAGEKNINGIDTKGIFVEINGLKFANLLREVMPQIYQEAGIEEKSAIDQEEVADAMEGIFSALNLNKLNYTVWIGKDDHIPYAYNGEVAVRISDISGGLANTPAEAGFNMSFDMTVSDINKLQNIEAPVVVESPTDTGL